MPRVLRRLTLAFLAILLAACQSTPTSHPVPSVAQIGGDMNCVAGDHGFSDPQVGWGFCYPGTWQYNEKSQPDTAPVGLDLTFDITDVPCTQPSAASGSPSAAPSCLPGAGLFGFMIVSTYQRGDSTSIVSWVQANGKNVSISQTVVMSAISWGDSSEAYKMDDGRRIALTPHHVVILDLHSNVSSGAGHLDLEGLMSTRLYTWKFTF